MLAPTTNQDIYHYTTRDIYIASVLLALDYKLETFKKEDKVFWFTFYYPKATLKTFPPDIIETDVKEYWDDKLRISPKKLFNSFKELKQRMYNNQATSDGENYGV